MRILRILPRALVALAGAAGAFGALPLPPMPSQDPAATSASAPELAKDAAGRLRWGRWSMAAVEAHRAAGKRPWHEFLRVPSKSAGTYKLAAGAEDRQSPHEQDEIYYVLEGRGKLQVGDVAREVRLDCGHGR
ncbi:MAG TPA: hypothetical protein VGC54_10485, partial [Planctomycetota bacterium]